MSVRIAHASIDERGKISGGQAGDQTGKEVCIRDWYNKPWGCVIRFRDESMANKLADCMEMAAANIYIGYDQSQRNTLLNKARKYNYNISKVKEPCETDCSALVSVACMYAGVPESMLTLNGNCAHTRNLRPMLKATGEVDIFTTIPYVAKTDKLKRGDILLKEGSHVAVVVDTGKEQKSIDEIAREVIKGKWGSGDQRKQLLRAAGYNPQMVQARVNEILASQK
jgi:hypothetical protein